MRKIIGICGFIGSGKGSVSDILVSYHGFTKINFADKLKEGVSAVFGWDRKLLEGDTIESRIWRETVDEFWSSELNRTITPRLVLQLFGTECMREGFDEEIWVSLVKQELLKYSNLNYVIPDVRFSNEKHMIRSLGGEIWAVERGARPDWFQLAISDNLAGTDFMKDTNIHESEYRWVEPDHEFDIIIRNDSTLLDLKNVVNDKLRG